MKKKVTRPKPQELEVPEVGLARGSFVRINELVNYY